MTYVAPPGAPIVPIGLAEGIAALAGRDPDFAAIIATAGTPRFPQRTVGFGTLLHIILEQQVSVDAAAAMYRRLQQSCSPLAPETFLALDDATLKRCGFSRQKAGYARHLAEEMRADRFDPARVAALDDEAALAMLMRLKGIGRWSAEIYLLFALGRADLWPADDLGLQVAVQWWKRLDARPRAPDLRGMAEAWRPWRSVAACLLWQFYLHRLGRLSGPLRNRATPAAPAPRHSANTSPRRSRPPA